MQRLSQRISAVKPSPTVALNGKAKAMRREGIAVINLTVGEPDFPTPSSVCDVAIAAIKSGKTKYGPAGGGPDLRAAIQAKLERENNLKFDTDQIVAGIGAKELLFHISLAMLNEGDEVLIPAPYWVSYTAHCEAAGATAVEIPMLDPQNPVVTPEQLEKYATPRTKAIVLNSPNNPGGYMMSEAQVESLAKYLQSKPWWIISDEIYEYLCFDGKHSCVVDFEPELQDRYIHVNGLSKGFAMTGWRVGYCAGPSDLMRLVRTLQTQSSTCLPPFIEEAAAFALNQGKSLLAEGIETFKKRRDLVVDAIRKIPNVGFIPPTGAFYLFIDLRQRLAEKNKSSLEFAEYLLEASHVAMVPGEAFGVPGFIRMSYAAAEADLIAGIQKLGEALDRI